MSSFKPYDFSAEKEKLGENEPKKKEKAFIVDENLFKEKMELIQEELGNISSGISDLVPYAIHGTCPSLTFIEKVKKSPNIKTLEKLFELFSQDFGKKFGDFAEFHLRKTIVEEKDEKTV